MEPAVEPVVPPVVPPALPAVEPPVVAPVPEPPVVEASAAVLPPVVVPPAVVLPVVLPAVEDISDEPEPLIDPPDESDDIAPLLASLLLASVDDPLVLPLVEPPEPALSLPPQLLKVSEVANIEAARIINGVFFIKKSKDERMVGEWVEKRFGSSTQLVYYELGRARKIVG